MIVSYFAERPEIVKIFDDLEKFRDFCRFNTDNRGGFFPFNEAHLYDNSNYVWRAFQNQGRRFNKNRNRNKNYTRKH